MADAHPIALVQPKDSGGQAKDRRWTLIRKDGPIIEHIDLMGTTYGDPDGAKAAAAQLLGYKPRWAQLANGNYTAPPKGANTRKGK